MQATLHGNSPCHSSFPSSYSSPPYNFLLYSEELGKCFGFFPLPFAVTASLRLLLVTASPARYLSAPWCLLCTLNEDPDPGFWIAWASQMVTTVGTGRGASMSN